MRKTVFCLLLAVDFFSSSRIKRHVFCLFLAVGFSTSLKAQGFQEFVIADIIVEGYQRISPGIIYNLLPVGIGDDVTTTTPAQIIRALSQSGYFDEVEVSRDDNILVITVLERPSVAEINIEGNVNGYRHSLLLDANKPRSSDNERDRNLDAYFAVHEKYRGIPTQRQIAMPMIMPIAEFIAGIETEPAE